MVSGDTTRASIIDADVRREFQQSRLLLQIRLSPNEVVALKQPSPLFVAVARLSYLPSVFQDLFEHFEEYIPPRMGRDYEVWFDIDSTPVPWQYPIGVFADSLPSARGPQLFLTVHFQSRPAELLPFSGIGSLEPLFMNALRESTYLSHTSANPFMRLSKGAQATMWESLLNDDFASFADAEKDLQWLSLDQCKSLAIRWHIMVEKTREILLAPVSVFRDDGEPRTIEDELNAKLPMVDDYEVRSLGVDLPRCTPLYWICVHAAYFDGFAHLVVHVFS